MQCIENVNVFTEDNCFHPGTVWIEGKRISRVELDDAKGMHRTPLEAENTDINRNKNINNRKEQNFVKIFNKIT